MLPACPATTTILMPSVTHTHSHLHALVCNGRWPCSCADDAQLCSHTLTPLMTSMTSPLALAQDETVAVINCDAHVDTTNHTPTTTRPSPGPPAFRGTSVVFAFALFHPSNAFCGTVPARSNKTTSSCPEQASRAESTIAPQGYALLCLRLLNCPIPSHSQAELYHLSLQIARRFREHKHLH